MLREVGGFIIAPIVLVGMLYVTDIKANFSEETKEKSPAPIITALSGKQGLGIGARVSRFVGSVDAHYGFEFSHKDYAISILPKFGVGLGHTYELPQGVQFSLGVQSLISYEKYIVGVEYWHQSNGAGLGMNVSDGKNIGLDMIVFQGGYQF